MHIWHEVLEQQDEDDAESAATSVQHLKLKSLKSVSIFSLIKKIIYSITIQHFSEQHSFESLSFGAPVQSQSIEPHEPQSLI